MKGPITYEEMKKVTVHEPSLALQRDIQSFTFLFEIDLGDYLILYKNAVCSLLKLFHYVRVLFIHRKCIKSLLCEKPESQLLNFSLRRTIKINH